MKRRAMTTNPKGAIKCVACGEPAPNIPGPPPLPPYYCTKHMDQRPPRKGFA